VTANNVDGESDIRTCSHATKVDGIKNGTEGFVIDGRKKGPCPKGRRCRRRDREWGTSGELKSCCRACVSTSIPLHNTYVQGSYLSF
jgi:hypothetical protein